jgi:hypothetical protein
VSYPMPAVTARCLLPEPAGAETAAGVGRGLAIARLRPPLLGSSIAPPLLLAALVGLALSQVAFGHFVAD